jgi:AmiR/NasT family two-component response regulator
MKPKTGRRVLIVEDDFLVGEMIRGLVEEIGHAVVGRAADGREAFEMTRSLRPDAILMDIAMPDTDGIEATRQILACCPTPVVILTAYETPELVARASAAGAGAYLVKPASAPEMERAIAVATARFDDMMELRRLNGELQARNTELQEALANIKILRGLLPICASCKRIRDDQGYWQQVEVYIRDHSEAEFSHGICPDCARKLYPNYYKE